MTFREELEALINKHSLENISDTPDFVLASFLMQSLDAFDTAILRREDWYDRKDTNATENKESGSVESGR